MTFPLLYFAPLLFLCLCAGVGIHFNSRSTAYTYFSIMFYNACFSIFLSSPLRTPYFCALLNE